VIIMDDSLRKLLPDWVILIEIEGVQWLETATCERGFSLRTQILTTHRHSMGDSLLACLMMICSNGPSSVCVCVHATSICVRENLHLHFLIFFCVFACNREGTSHTSSRVDGRLE
jgi:hypothetical protein